MLHKSAQGSRPVLQTPAAPRRKRVLVFALEGPSFVAQGGSPVLSLVCDIRGPLCLPHHGSALTWKLTSAFEPAFTSAVSLVC